MRQSHYQWTFSSSIADEQVAVYFDNIDLRRYYGGMSKITVVDSRNTSFLSVQNQRHHPVGFLITNPPLMISFYSSHKSRIGRSVNGILMRYFVFSGSDEGSPCSEKFNLTVTDVESGRINISWTSLTTYPHTNVSGDPTYLVFYNSTAKGVNNFTLITNLTSAVIDYLSFNAWYSIEVVAFFYGSNNIERACPVLVKTADK
ncbi:uncharacterized protein LOC116305764, partial [Actinia tenebrosa]|uniref:Uncharacterized protein LOC116305764 n=1 Tax=Actinia tenebrosa TaxID=6105 RepID=A0A6P8J1D2_ACTTE